MSNMVASRDVKVELLEVPTVNWNFDFEIFLAKYILAKLFSVLGFILKC